MRHMAGSPDESSLFLRENSCAMAMQRKSSLNTPHEDRQFVLFYAKEMKDLAEQIADSCLFVTLGASVWGRYIDKFPNIFVERAWKLKQVHAVFLASFHSPEIIFEQVAMIQSIPGFQVQSFKVIVPWFPTGTMERVSHFGEVATAKTLSRMLSTTPPSSNGPTQFHILDIHALGNQHYFSDTVQVSMRSCIPLLFEEIRAWKPLNLAIVFPDDGAMKRFGGRFAKFPTIVCQKVRLGDQRVVEIKTGQPQNKHCLIVDDMVQSGEQNLNYQSFLLSTCFIIIILINHRCHYIIEGYVKTII